MNTSQHAREEVERIINVARAGAPDRNYVDSFVLGALEAHATRWLVQKWQLEKQVEELKQAINEMKTYA